MFLSSSDVFELFPCNQSANQKSNILKIYFLQQKNQICIEKTEFFVIKSKFILIDMTLQNSREMAKKITGYLFNAEYEMIEKVIV